MSAPSLRTRVDEYLALRRSLGFTLRRDGLILHQFVGHCEAAGIATITTEAAVGWAKLPQDGSASWWAWRLSIVRVFAKHLQAIDPATEVPPTGVFPAAKQRIVPYPYTEADIVNLMAAADHLRYPLHAATYRSLIGLLAVTGMRIGEAIALTQGDVSLDTGVIAIRNGKFAKSREVPLHASTVAALQDYGRIRNQCCPDPAVPSFFVNIKGTRLDYNRVQPVFARLCRQVGLVARSECCRPRIHDLRHRFAITTLLNWYRCGADVEVMLPLLSTFMGHTEPKWTYWYLTATPELLAIVGERVEAVLGDLP
jgi:integrase/recombinase XerD